MIKATFPNGVTQLTVSGLHQWDYGQTLQIEAAGLPALVEVHFACEGMTDAVVRSCSVDTGGTLGKLTAAIPDECLEQTSPVVAWVYYVGLTEGETVLTVVMPIIARTRPAQAPTVPAIITDKYTELVDAINEQVERLTDGDVTVSNAENAEYAEFAREAELARTAEGANIASEVTGEVGESSAHRYVWFSVNGSPNKRAYSENFKYNPATDTMKVGKVDGTAASAESLDLPDYTTYTSGQKIPGGVYLMIDGDASVIVDTKASHSAAYPFSPDEGTSALVCLTFAGSEADGYTIRRLQLASSDYGSNIDFRYVNDNATGVKYRRLMGYSVG